MPQPPAEDTCPSERYVHPDRDVGRPDWAGTAADCRQEGLSLGIGLEPVVESTEAAQSSASTMDAMLPVASPATRAAITRTFLAPCFSSRAFALRASARKSSYRSSLTVYVDTVTTAIAPPFLLRAPVSDPAVYR